MKSPHVFEQRAYAEIRKALSDSFIAAPKEFMEHFGCRPEDLTGAQLRSYYPHFLTQDIKVESDNPEFIAEFYSGSIF